MIFIGTDYSLYDIILAAGYVVLLLVILCYFDSYIL